MNTAAPYPHRDDLAQFFVGSDCVIPKSHVASMTGCLCTKATGDSWYALRSLHTAILSMNKVCVKMSMVSLHAAMGNIYRLAAARDMMIFPA